MTSETNMTNVDNLYDKAEELRDQVAKYIFREPDDKLEEKIRVFSADLTKEVSNIILEVLGDEETSLEDLKVLTSNLVVLLRLLQQSPKISSQKASSLQELSTWLENDVIDLLLNPILIATIGIESGDQGNTPKPPKDSDMPETGDQGNTPKPPGGSGMMLTDASKPFFLGVNTNLLQKAGEGNTPRNPPINSAPKG